MYRANSCSASGCTVAAPEIEQLVRAYARVSAGEVKNALVRSRYSGVGKNVVDDRGQSAVVRDRGYFASAKYDQLRRNIPYSSLIQAFKSGAANSCRNRERVTYWRRNYLQPSETMGRSSPRSSPGRAHHRPATARVGRLSTGKDITMMLVIRQVDIALVYRFPGMTWQRGRYPLTHRLVFVDQRRHGRLRADDELDWG